MIVTTEDPQHWIRDVVPPGEKRHIQYPISETYQGNNLELPVTIINGEYDGPWLFLSAAIHGDELNGVKVLQKAATRYQPDELHGGLICLHVLNVPGFIAHQRTIPIYDQDLNRAFPGNADGTTAARIAHEIYQRFITHCDIGIDFHTSTRNRTTLFHVRANTDDKRVERLALSFGANIIISGAGSRGMLRKEATDDGVPTIVVEMGKAHRFQSWLIEEALSGIESVMNEYGLLPDREVRWPGWFRVIEATTEKKWIRADNGGLVDMTWGPYPFVYEDDVICKISGHFDQEKNEVRAPFTGLLVGILENPVAVPGHPVCHLVRTDRSTKREIEAEIRRGEFLGYRER
ncbi:succinylglutamate desuccinylase/aspartoacylase family protein [Natrinema gelatinilyticum]|uniref:succinylglutamate desuccinylase/aspartoacylase family protein n=1 Tax=Natrinema gelatinilyticum TaxID=2961571 RepID=UPI003CE58007